MNRRLIPLLFLLVASFSIAAAQQDLLADIRNLSSDEIKFDAFRLDTDQEVTITGTVTGDRNRNVYNDVWILNTQTREIVWKLKYSKRSSRSRGLVDFDDKLSLSKGEYEIYLSAFPSYIQDVNNFGDLMELLTDKIFRSSDRERNYRRLVVTVKGRGVHYGNEGVEKLHARLCDDAVVAMTRQSHDEYSKQGFTLDKQMELNIYAIGELRDDGQFDFGWIINTKTGERVWSMEYRSSSHAGGDKKNRMVKETITLPAGSYAAHYVSDDSHSYGDWNAAPPFDPMFWGLTIHTKDPAMKKYTRLFEFNAFEEKNVIASLTRVRSEKLESKGFTLTKPMDVRIYAIGEGSNDRMVDYGWIVNMKTRSKVWSMEYNETTHAGGGQKNRIVNTIIHLEKGSYMVYYTTDDSHAYRDWNTAAPYDPEHWGITLSSADPEFNATSIRPYSETDDPSILARLVGIRDDERRKQSFSLSKKSDLHLYALGEGRDGDMVDYAWIEDASTRKIVWEMTYRSTEHAGGSKKNRVFDGTITLPAGKYILFYESDGSHSFNNWNEDPPDDPYHWGVTITLKRSD
ncbi:MAG: hypothetical protein V1799_17080 [bacterium]